MSVDAEHPVDLLRDLVGDLPYHRGDPRHLLLPLRAEKGRARREEHLRLEDETVAHHLHPLAITEDLAHPPEELRPIAREIPGLGLEPLALAGLEFRPRLLLRRDPRERRVEIGAERLDLDL